MRKWGAWALTFDFWQARVLPGSKTGAGLRTPKIWLDVGKNPPPNMARGFAAF